MKETLPIIFATLLGLVTGGCATYFAFVKSMTRETFWRAFTLSTSPGVRASMIVALQDVEGKVFISADLVNEIRASKSELEDLLKMHGVDP